MKFEKKSQDRLAWERGKRRIRAEVQVILADVREEVLNEGLDEWTTQFVEAQQRGTRLELKGAPEALEFVQKKLQKRLAR